MIDWEGWAFSPATDASGAVSGIAIDISFSPDKKDALRGLTVILWAFIIPVW